MRVLIINKFLYPNGGSETYIFKLGEALEQHGHEVQYFGMEHEGRCVGNRVNAYTMVWERALSLRNPWIQQMEQYKTPEALDRNFVKKYIEQVVVTFLGDRQAEISLTMKTEEWKQMLERIELEGTDDGTKK